MRKTLASLDNVVSSIDNLIMHIDYWKVPMQILEELFRYLQHANLTTRTLKFVFGAELVEFLGYHIGYDCIIVNNDNLQKTGTGRRRKSDHFWGSQSISVFIFRHSQLSLLR